MTMDDPHALLVRTASRLAEITVKLNEAKQRLERHVIDYGERAQALEAQLEQLRAEQRAGQMQLQKEINALDRRRHEVVEELAAVAEGRLS